MKDQYSPFILVTRHLNVYIYSLPDSDLVLAWSSGVFVHRIGESNPAKRQIKTKPILHNTHHRQFTTHNTYLSLPTVMALVRGLISPDGSSRDLTFSVNPSTTHPIRVVSRTARSGLESLMGHELARVIAAGTTY